MSGKYSFRLVTLKKRTLQSKPGAVKGKLDVPGRVDVHVIDAANLQIENGKPCEDVQLGFSSDEQEVNVAPPHLVCWNPKYDSDGKTTVVIWSEDGKTADYSFTAQER